MLYQHWSLPPCSSKPSSVTTRPFPLSSTEAHCWLSFINAHINLPLHSLSLQQFICSQFNCVVVIVCVPSSCLLPFTPHSLLWLSRSICSLICSLYCSPHSISSMSHQQWLCEWLSEKITLLLQTNSSLFASPVVFCSEREAEKWLQWNLPAPGLEECTSIKDSGEI